MAGAFREMADHFATATVRFPSGGYETQTNAEIATIHPSPPRCTGTGRHRGEAILHPLLIPSLRDAPCLFPGSVHSHRGVYSSLSPAIFVGLAAFASIVKRLRDKSRNFASLPGSGRYGRVFHEPAGFSRRRFRDGACTRIDNPGSTPAQDRKLSLSRRDRRTMTLMEGKAAAGYAERVAECPNAGRSIPLQWRKTTAATGSYLGTGRKFATRGTGSRSIDIAASS
jgi:hypothetical protein